MTETRFAVVGTDTELGARLVAAARFRPGLQLVGEAAEPRGAEAADALAVLDALSGLRAGDSALLCVRRGRAQELVLSLLERGVRAIDLSGDHALPASLYAQAHPELGPHRHPRLIARAVPGLWQVHGHAPPTARLVSIPSAGAAAALLALVPLARAGLLAADRAAVIIVAGAAALVEAGLTPSPRGNDASRSAGDLRSEESGCSHAAGGSDGTGDAGRGAGGSGCTDDAKPGACGRVRVCRGADPLQHELEHALTTLLPGPVRVTCARVLAGGAGGLVALVSADVASSRACEPAAVRAALDALVRGRTSRLRLSPHGAEAPIPGDPGVAELSVHVDAWSERVTAACALDPLSWSPEAALDALRAPQSA